jgi:deoxyribodipyrimidine photolyase-related protein
MTDDRTVWVLGDQLTTQVGPLADGPDAVGRVLLIEARAFARKHPYHPHKLTLLFSAMRHFRERLDREGFVVEYHRAETFGEGLDAHFETHPGDDLHLMRAPGHGAVDRLREMVAERGGSLTVLDNDLFFLTPAEFDEWAGDDATLRHESFYRFQRRRTGYLMDGDDPVGGEWNFDEENRETPPDDWESPPVPRYGPDEITAEVSAWVREEFDGGYDDPPYGGDWADPEAFFWPVTREGARDALERFVDERLGEFGPYQDAMLEDDQTLNHALLSAAVNVGLLTARECVEAAVDAYRERDDVPLASVEGFVRQLLGWREFVRHVYRRAMPEMATANQLDATADLPDLFWTGETEMACVESAVEGVRERGYSHHIQRLMVLSNFATTYGVEPAQVNRWFHAGYVDAYHWVTTPNVMGMGTFADDVLSTKPYVASANYVDDMSDHCANCPYYKTKTTGENACPFNALYWDFLGRNEDALRENHRMSLVYSHWDDKSAEERAAVRDRADRLREWARETRV